MRGPSATEKLTAITLGLIAVISPLYIDRRSLFEPEDEEDDDGFGFSAWLPVLLVLLIVAINVTCFLDRRFMRFDPYWIHRVGGSSFGIVLLLIVLGFVLKCKASLNS